MRTLIVCLLMLITSGCDQKLEAPVEVSEKSKISRVFQSNPEINQVQIKTPETEIDGITEKALVFERKVGEDGESFEFDLKGKVHQQLNDVNRGRIVIKFDDGEILSFSKSSSGMISTVIDVSLTLDGILMGLFAKNEDLIKSLKKKRVTSFYLEGFSTEVPKSEAEAFRKDFNTILSMK